MLAIILWALIAGTILGYLGPALLPGRQDIPIWATIPAGIAAAFVGGLVANGLGAGSGQGAGWWSHIIQIVFAIAAVWLVARLVGRGRGSANTTGKAPPRSVR